MKKCEFPVWESIVAIFVIAALLLWRVGDGKGSCESYDAAKAAQTCVAKYCSTCKSGVCCCEKEQAEKPSCISTGGTPMLPSTRRTNPCEDSSRHSP